MRVNSVRLNNFRNYGMFEAVFNNNVNIIYGANATGKTTLLESIFMFATGRSFRCGKENEVIKFGCDKGECAIDFSDRYSDNRLKLCIRKNKAKLVIKNGMPVSKMSEYLGAFRAVVFTPDHLSLAKGSPEFRRRFIDLALCQFNAAYVASLNEYTRLTAHKNAALKRICAMYGNYKPDNQLLQLVEVYNEKLAYLSGKISVSRKKYIKSLETEAKALHYEISGEKEELALKYISHVCGAETEEDFINGYKALYASKLQFEIQRGITSVGPHKDDFGIFINGKSVRLFSSQGQQRTAVLCLKLAEGELSKAITGEYPVFLLDDVLSELDVSRKDELLKKLSGKQVILTCCERDSFEEPEAKIIEIKQ